MKATLKQAGIWFHTLRFLKLRQILGRIHHRLNKVYVDSTVEIELSSRSGDCVGFARRHPSMSGPHQFVFLNKFGKLKIGSDWNNPFYTKLWLYNLHYFDDLNAFQADTREHWHRELIRSWINENPIGVGNGWEPYPSSVRIVNWIKWALSSSKLDKVSNLSLAIQVRYLSKQLEYHLLGNHLFVNAKALVFSGLYFQGDEACIWLRKGLEILKNEVSEQILADGGHFELSPMYHALVLEDILDLLNIFEVYAERIPSPYIKFIDSLKPIAAAMISWMQTMVHPDGQISMFNDSALEIAPSPQELETYANRLGIEVSSSSEEFVQLTESGYIRVQKQNLVAILDVAFIGPNYLPGHAHADTLSFELSAFDQRVLVNSGTSCYGIDEERQRQRSTAAHNTVEVNGENSSEVWSGFRVARRARPFDLKVVKLDEVIKVSCSHNGYKRLRGKPIHNRHWQFDENTMTISDTIHGEYDNATAYYHFHPDVVLDYSDDCKSGLAKLRDGHQLMWQVLAGKPSFEVTSYHPEFGSSRESQCLTVEFESYNILIQFRGFS